MGSGEGGAGGGEAGLGGGPGGVRVLAGLGVDGGGEGEFVADVVEDGEEGGAEEDGVREGERVRGGAGQGLHEADHVVAEVADEAADHGGHAGGEGEAGFGDEGAKGVERGLRVRGEGMRVGEGVAVDVGGAVAGAPDEVWRHADDGVSAAGGAAFDAFEEEGVGGVLGEFEEGGDGGFEVRHAGPEGERRQGLCP
jgi:hypothetical protein